MRFQADMITAVSAIVVSVAALFVAADQAKISRQPSEIITQQVNGSIWPAVQFGKFRFFDEKFR